MGDPVAVLLDESDPVRRARAHLALGERAIARDALELATEHLREAVDLDPTDEQPKALLAKLAQRNDGNRRKRSWWPLGRR